MREEREEVRKVAEPVRWRWHWQNLNERHEGGTGSGWQHGRAWLWRGDTNVAYASWHFRADGDVGLTVTRAGTYSDRESDVLVGVDFLLVSFWIGVSARWLRSRRPAGDARKYGLTYSAEHDHLHWSWGASEFGDGRPSWRSRGWFLRDVLLGRAKYASTPYRREAVTIPMPEAAYPAVVTLEKATWKRPRWPWARTVYRASVDIPGGVPCPGKRDDDDGLYGLTRPARSVAEAIGACVESAERMRRRHGGPDWRPRPDRVTAALDRAAAHALTEAP